MGETISDMLTPASYPSSLLTDWLGRGADRKTLLKWLRGGEDLALLGTEVPPYFRILSAIPDQGDDQCKVRRKLAEKAVELLELEPDLHSDAFGVDSREIIYNLLYLCAGLSLPSVLAKPLLAMHDRHQLGGSWNGILLVDALRDAIIENQNHSTKLVATWEAMLTGKPAAFLEGNEVAGFRGLVNATDCHGQPHLLNISRAVRFMADYVDRKKGSRRREEFQQHAKYVDQCYAFRGGLSDREWLDVAITAELPRWAAESLPKLSYRPSEGPVVVWWPVVSCVPFDYHPVKPLCDGAALELDPGPRARQFISTVWPVFEKSRQQFTYDSPRAHFCMLNQIYMELEDRWRLERNTEFAKFIHESRERLLREALADRAQDHFEIQNFDRVCKELAEYAQRRFHRAKTT